MPATAEGEEVCVGKENVDSVVVSNGNHQDWKAVGTSVVALLRACAQKKDLCKGTRVHADVLKRGLFGKNPYVASSLVSMYAKCGALPKAQQVLDELPVRNIISWNALIAGYACQGQGEAALDCFERMQWEGISPDAVTFACILKACGSIGALDKGKQIHDDIVNLGLLGKSIVLGNALLDMYAKCGVLAKAQQVLKELPIRDVVSWSSLIAGHVLQGEGKEALQCFEQMQHEGLSPDAVTYVCILKACGIIGAIDKGEQFHNEIVSQDLLVKNPLLGNALVDMYAKCGVLAKAQQVLDDLPVRSLVCWNALIAGYTQQKQGEQALRCFERMQCEGVSPNAVTFICILKACGSIGAIGKGIQIHEKIVSKGLLGKNIVLGTALMDMYVKCGALTKAAQVLHELPLRNAVTWSALVAGYAQQSQGEEALDCFEQMWWEGLPPNSFTFASILKACGSIGAADKGKQIHDEIVNQGLFEENIVLANSLVAMYAKCGAFAIAQQLLDELPVQDIVSWNALIAGYAQQNQDKEALLLFDWMQREGLSPSAVTFACILKACGSIGAADKGKQIHDKIVTQGFLGKDTVLGNALVDMYAKCGLLAEAQQVLDKLPVLDIVSWNALIAGYAQQVQAEEALNCFQRILQVGLTPNMITINCVLIACSRFGLVDEGQMFMGSMSERYAFAPSIENYTCMVDLFGRTGLFDRVMAVIKKMPSLDYLPVWSALLCACQKWGNLKLGKWAFEHAVQVAKNDAAAYVGMLNIYAAAGMLEEADKTEVRRLEHCCIKGASM